MIKIWCDGLCEPAYKGGPRNPNGCACYGYVILLENNTKVTGYDTIGAGKGMSNNVAEYTALIEALRKCIELGYGGEEIHIYSDSQLVVHQLNNSWRVKSPNIIPLWKKAMELCNNRDIKIEWIPREQNVEADALTRKAYKLFRKLGSVPKQTTNLDDYL